MARYFLTFFAVWTLFSCGTGGTAYYPRNHLVALYAEVGGKTTFLNWGDRLVFQNQIMTNTNKAGQATVYVKVQNAVDGSVGYVDADSVLKSPWARGVILQPAIAYETPTVVSRNKQAVVPPVLVYVTENRDSEWARIEPLNVRPVYTLTNTPGAIPPVQYAWVSWKDIATNQGDVDLIIALQLATKKYNDAKKLYESSPDEKNRQIFSDTVGPEVENLKKILERYPQAHPAVFGKVQEFLGVAAPDGSSGNTESTNGGEPEAAPEEEEL